MSYRDTASALAQHTPGNLIGVALYVPMNGQPARWGAVALMNLDALRDWYEDLAGSPTLYYYLAVFDKGRSTRPLVEVIAPPEPGMPGFDIRAQWRRPAWPVIDRVSGDLGRDTLAAYLQRMPGFVGAGRVLQNPHAPARDWFEIYEVHWLRGQPVPSLPVTIDSLPVRLVIVDSYPVAQTAVSGRGSRRGYRH